jgi:opacity protein-like surface antigen
MTAEGVFPKIDGDILYASEANDIHTITKQVYTGSTFDTNSGATTEASYEMTAVTSTNRDYVRIKITGAASVYSGGGSGTVELKAQIKETGGAYGDILAYQSVLSLSSNIIIIDVAGTYTHEIIATLTAGQKANGFRIKVFSKSSQSVSGTASFTNVQTVQELC